MVRPFPGLIALFVIVASASWSMAQELTPLARSLALHASFDQGIDADFSRGDRRAYVRQGNQVVPAAPNEEVQVAKADGKFHGSLHFTRKGTTRPQFNGADVLDYNDQDWNRSVSVWLRLSPDTDLEPGYCDPVQIVGDDSKKGFIFLEWSKDETPRFFRFAIRPLFSIWNPDNVQWADIPFAKRPMVQVANAPFRRDRWTHVVFTFEHINNDQQKPLGALYLDGEEQGRIQNWDLTFGWDPSRVLLVLGASYVGYMDDLSVFDRALTAGEVKQLYQLEGGVASLHR